MLYIEDVIAKMKSPTRAHVFYGRDGAKFYRKCGVVYIPFHLPQNESLSSCHWCKISREFYKSGDHDLGKVFYNSWMESDVLERHIEANGKHELLNFTMLCHV